MARINYDGVLEAVHYKPDGQVEWVRVYERRGAVFSDRMLLKRTQFIDELKAGKRYVVGERIPMQGAKFNVSQAVHLYERNGKQVIAVGEAQPGADDLSGVPVI